MFLIFLSERLISFYCHDYFFDNSWLNKLFHKKWVLLLWWLWDCYISFWPKIWFRYITWWSIRLFLWDLFDQSASHCVSWFIIFLFFKKKLFNFVDFLFYFKFFFCILCLIHILWQFLLYRHDNKTINSIKSGSYLLQIIWSRIRW